MRTCRPRAEALVGYGVLVAGLVGCGGPTPQVEIVATQFRPAPQSSGALAQQAGWKKGDAKAGGDNDPVVDRESDPDSRVTDPGTSNPRPDDTGVSTTDPDPMDTTVADTGGTVKNPFGGTDPSPSDPPVTIDDPAPTPIGASNPERLVPRSETIPPTKELLAGGWRGEPRHYVLEKGEWVEDSQFFVVDFGTTIDKKDEEIDVVRVSYEVDGKLVKLTPVPYTLDDVKQVASFSHPSMGPDPIVVRLVPNDRVEIRGNVQGFTVVRYYGKIPG